MGLLLLAAELYLPDVFRRRQLEKLFALTASAFGRPPPRVAGLSRRSLLHEFACFSREQALRSIGSEASAAAARERLYDGAYRIGADLRRVFGVNNAEEVMRSARMVYRALEIDLNGTADGEITVRRCFFSQYYTSPICQLISALDQGLLAGLSGGRQLEFWQRITDGSQCCLARLEPLEVNV